MKRILLSLLILGMFLLPNNASACIGIGTYWCGDYDVQDECTKQCKSFSQGFCSDGTVLDYWSAIIYEPSCSSYEGCWCEVVCTSNDCPLV